MALIASWDGLRLELWDEQGERQFVFEPAPAHPEDSAANGAMSASGPDESGEASVAEDSVAESVLALSSVDAPVDALLLPVEGLLERPFSVPVEHARFIDAAMLAQELADQAGVEESEWWLCWQAERVGAGVCGLAFALPEGLRQEFSAAPISRQCPYIGPDIAVRLAAHLGAGTNAAAVLDADAEGLMLGVYADGVWRGMRRLNLCAGRSRAMLAQEAVASLKAMGFDAGSMPVNGRLNVAWKQAFEALEAPSGIDWCVDVPDEALSGAEAEASGSTQDQLPTRHAANALAMAALSGELPFNFRHGAWAVQTDWSKHIGPWRRTAVLLAALCLLSIGQDAYRLQQVQARQEAARNGVEQAFHQALPGVAMLDPMLQLRQAAGGGAAGDTWKFVRQLNAITELGKRESAFRVQGISYADGEVLLSGMAPDFAAANRIRDALASILGRKVDLLDTDLSDKQVRIRLRWSS